MTNPSWDSLQLVSEPTILGHAFVSTSKPYYYPYCYPSPQVPAMTAIPETHFHNSSNPYEAQRREVEQRISAEPNFIGSEPYPFHYPYYNAAPNITFNVASFEYYHGYSQSYGQVPYAYHFDGNYPNFYFKEAATVLWHRDQQTMTTKFRQNKKKKGYVNACQGRIGKHRKHSCGMHHHMILFDKDHDGHLRKVGIRYFHKHKNLSEQERTGTTSLQNSVVTEAKDEKDFVDSDECASVESENKEEGYSLGDQLFDTIPQKNEIDVLDNQWEIIYNLICSDYESHLVHKDCEVLPYEDDRKSENYEYQVFDEFPPKNEAELLVKLYSTNMMEGKHGVKMKSLVLGIDFQVDYEGKNRELLNLSEINSDELKASSEPIQLNGGLGIDVELKPIVESNNRLAEIGGIDRQVIERFEKEAVEMNKRPDKYNWVLEKLKVERERGITFNIARRKFEMTEYYCTVIDAPGHTDLIKSMITGKSQVDHVVLIIDSTVGGFVADISKDGQTCKLTLLAFTRGVKEIICYCNKMDATAPKYSHARGIDLVQGEPGKILYCLGGKLPKGILFADFARTIASKLTDHFEETRSIKIIQDVDQYIMWWDHNFGIVACDFLDTGQGISVRKIFAILTNTSMLSKFSADTLRNYVNKESNKYLASVPSTFILIYSIMAAGTFDFGEGKAFGRTPITNIDPRKTWEGARTGLGGSRSVLGAVKLVQLKKLLCGVKVVSGCLPLSLEITQSGGITFLILDNIWVIKLLIGSGSEDIFEDATHKVKVTGSGLTTVLPDYELIREGKVLSEFMARDNRMRLGSEQLFIIMKGSVRKIFGANAIMSIQDSIFYRVDAGECQLRVVSTFMQERLEISWNMKRGTDVLTYDDLSLAWAICELIGEAIKASALFSTHFDELTVLVNVNGDNWHKQIVGVANFLKCDNLGELIVLKLLLHYFTSIAELSSCIVPTVGTTQLMFNVFASLMWMMSFSKYGTTERVHWRQSFVGSEKDLLVCYCEEHKLQSSYSESNFSGMEVHDDIAYMYKKKAKANLYHTCRKLYTLKGELSVISKDSKVIEVLEGINFAAGVETIFLSARAGEVSIATITSLLLNELCLLVVWELTMVITHNNKLLQCQRGNWLVH